MNKTLFITATTLCVLGFTASAQKEPGAQNQLQISYSNSFNKIVVEDGIELVLTEGASTELGANGGPVNIAKVVYRIDDSTLYLSGNAGSFINYVQVSLQVHNLRQITINGDSRVKSKGNLRSSSLRILVNGEAMVNVTNIGKISIQNSKDIELDIRKSTRGVLFERASGR